LTIETPTGKFNVSILMPRHFGMAVWQENVILRCKKLVILHLNQMCQTFWLGTFFFKKIPQKRLQKIVSINK
jgi:hypothetical protein